MRVRKLQPGDKNVCGARVEKRRKELGMKQKDLLTRLQVNGVDLSASALSKIEGQTRSVSDAELSVLSDILNISMEWLVGKA